MLKNEVVERVGGFSKTDFHIVQRQSSGVASVRGDAVLFDSKVFKLLVWDLIIQVSFFFIIIITSVSQSRSVPALLE